MRNTFDFMVEALLMDSNVFADDPTELKINGYTAVVPLSEKLDYEKGTCYDTKKIMKIFSSYEAIDVSPIFNNISAYDVIESGCFDLNPKFKETIRELLGLHTMFAFIEDNLSTFCFFVSSWKMYTPLYCVLKVEELPRI